MDIFVDGGFKNQAMYVAVTSSDSSINFAKQIALGGTNNRSEKYALLECLRYLESIGFKELVTVYTDMQSLPELLKRTDLKPKNIKRNPELIELSFLIRRLNVNLRYIKSKKNKADKLIKQLYK